MKLAGHLPVPRLTATIAQPFARNGLGRVTIRDYTPPPREEPRGPIQHRGPHHCTRCGQAGHNAANRKCPARSDG